MTIHTFEVSSMLTNKDYYKIQLELKTKDPSKWKATNDGMQYWGLSDKGIIINMHQIKKKGFYSYSIIYRISARRVIDNNDFVGLFDTEDYYDLEVKVNDLLKDKCSTLPKLKKCTLKRVDFCINAVLDNQDQVKAYIKTAKRSNVPSKLEIYQQYDKKSKRKKPTRDDYTVYSREYVAVSIYNKQRQMRKAKKGVYPDSEIKRAENIVRIEIRCMEGKIHALRKKYNIKTISSFMRASRKIGDELYRYYLSKMFGKGIICTLKEALACIDMSEYSKKSIRLLKEFIEDANNFRSASETIKLYKCIYSKNTIKRILDLFDNINTNYVTITNADAKLFGRGGIPTPLELYEDVVERGEKLVHTS